MLLGVSLDSSFKLQHYLFRHRHVIKKQMHQCHNVEHMVQFNGKKDRTGTISHWGHFFQIVRPMFM